MAEALQSNLKDIDEVFQWTQVRQGLIEMNDEEKSVLESHNWEPLVSMIGIKLIEKYKNLIQEEGIINFFPSDRGEFNNMMVAQNTTFMGQSLVKPLFVVKFDKDKHIEFTNRFEEKIPKSIIFIILCNK